MGYPRPGLGGRALDALIRPPPSQQPRAARSGACAAAPTPGLASRALITEPPTHVAASRSRNRSRACTRARLQPALHLLHSKPQLSPAPGGGRPRAPPSPPNLSTLARGACPAPRRLAQRCPPPTPLTHPSASGRAVAPRRCGPSPAVVAVAVAAPRRLVGRRAGFAPGGTKPHQNACDRGRARARARARGRPGQSMGNPVEKGDPSGGTGCVRHVEPGFPRRFGCSFRFRFRVRGAGNPRAPNGFKMMRLIWIPSYCKHIAVSRTGYAPIFICILML